MEMLHPFPEQARLPPSFAGQPSSGPSVLQWSGIQMDDTPFWLSVLETWEADERLSWTHAVLLRRAQDTGLALWSRNTRDFGRYTLPESPWSSVTEQAGVVTIAGRQNGEAPEDRQLT